MLRALGEDVVALKDVLAHDTSDTDLFKFLAGSEYVLISQDRKQLTRVAEAAALKAAGISALYFGPFWSRLGFWRQATYLIKNWSDFDTALQRFDKGSIVEAKQNGKLITMQ
jgi:hypothetical protein